MTREELYQTIYTHDTIYLPPHEEKDVPLEVSLGCSWHKCTFCDFARDTFQLHPLEKIEQSLRVLAVLRPEDTRMFFLGENAFCMGTDQLLSIIALADNYMPNLKEYAMYSRIDDILRKTDEELLLLRGKGIEALHIGVESGSDSILAERKKGITSAQTVEALLRLGGQSFSYMNAVETARMLNKVHPRNIWCLKLKLWEGTPLYKEAQNGTFDMMTPEQIIKEERLLIQNLSVTDCLFEDTTVLDKYTIRGMLPEQKDVLLHAIDYLLNLENRNSKV